MKNSLFKRAIAAVATVPIAFTQCLTFAYAETNNSDVQLIAAAPATDDVVTMQKLLRIDPDQTEATWNYQVYQLLVSGAIEQAGPLYVEDYRDEIVSRAGRFTELANYALDLIKDAKYEITGSGDIVITGTLEDPDVSLPIAYTPGEAITKVADNYNAPGLKNLDYSSIKAGGKFKITLGTSALNSSTDVTIKTEYTNEDGTQGFGDLLEYALAKTEAVREIGLKGIEEQVAPDKVTEAKIEYNKNVNFFANKIKRLIHYEDKILNSTRDYSAKDLEDAIAQTNNRLERTRIKRRIPSTIDEITQKSIAFKLVNSIVSRANGSLTFNVDDVNQLLHSLYAIDLDLDAGNAVATAFFNDDEIDEVKQWVEAQGNTFVSSKKKVTIKGSYAKGVDSGDIDVKIERVLETTPGTTPITTSSTETTTVSTTSSTESTSSSTETTSASTTSSTETTTVSTSSATVTTSVSTSSSTDSTTSSTNTTSSTDSTTSSTNTTSSTDSTTSSTNTTSSTASTTSSTDSTTSSTETTTVSTSSATETSSISTETTTVTLPVATTSVVKSYVTVKTETGFYTNIDAAFDKSKIKEAIRHDICVEGYTLDGEFVKTKDEFEVTSTVDADDITFGTATPENTFTTENNNFKYDIALYDAQGEALLNEDGTPATITVFIARKGDTNLDNLVDSNDASQILSYYARMSVGHEEGVEPAYVELLSKSSLVTSPSDEYEELAAFLSDVLITPEDETTAETKKSGRKIDSSDASRVLAFYVKISSEENKDKTDAEVWAQFDKKD